MINGKKIGIVILNYNSYNLTCNLAHKCLTMGIFDKVIIIDNNSNDNFEAYIDDEKSKELYYFKSKSNGGYAKGNNCGLRHLKECGFDIGFVANPDVSIDRECIEKIASFLINHSDYAIASCSRSQSHNKLTGQYWWIPDFKYTVLEALYFGRRYLDKKCIRITNNSLKHADGGNLSVEVVGGAFWGGNLEHLEKINYLDENTFLWYEENILSFKIRRAGMKIGFLTDCHYVHNHVKNGRGNRNMDKFLASKRYYCYEYLKINKFQKAVLAIFDAIGLFEERMICKIFKK